MGYHAACSRAQDSGLVVSAKGKEGFRVRHLVLVRTRGRRCPGCGACASTGGCMPPKCTPGCTMWWSGSKVDHPSSPLPYTLNPS